MNIEVFRHYLTWKDKKAELENDLDEAKERMEFFQNLIMDELVDNGVDSMRVDGRLVFPKKQMFVSAGSMTDETKQNLRDVGASDLIQETVNGQRLSAFVREYMKENSLDDTAKLPDWMKNNFSITEKVSLGVR